MWTMQCAYPTHNLTMWDAPNAWITINETIGNILITKYGEIWNQKITSEYTYMKCAGHGHESMWNGWTDDVMA